MACGAALGLENKKLEDSAFDASSFSGNYKPHMARLNLITGSGRYGGWRSAANNDKQWLRVSTLLHFVAALSGLESRFK